MAADGNHEAERIPALDVLRGIAILGLLPANLPAFALPLRVTGGPVHFVSPAANERVAFAAQQLFVSEKFITIFALLFGAGLAVQLGGRQASVLRTYRRLALLAGIGLAHVALLWSGDILFFYAAIGAVAVIALRIPIGPRLALGAAAALVPFAVALVKAFDTDLGGSLAGPTTIEAALAAPTRGSVGAELLLFRSDDWIAQAAWRVHTWTHLAAWVATLHAWRLLGLFLLGSVALEAGLFRPGRSAHARRAVIFGLAIGLPLELGYTAFKVQDLPYGPHMGFVAMHELGSLALACSYTGALLLVPGPWLLCGVFRWLGGVGRLALTNYLGQSLVCTTIFCGYGLGLYGAVTRTELWLVAGLLGCAQLLLSQLWLRWFVMGPVEWLWRTVTWGSWQTIRRTRPPTGAGRLAGVPQASVT
jgi:uncharacterized protein